MSQRSANVYNTTVVNNYTTVTRVSYNGGNGGINERPTSEDEAVAHERHLPPVAAQVQHVEAARANPQLRASENHGKPPIAATPKPGAFNEREVVPTKEGGRYNPPPSAGNNAAARTETGTAAHPTAVHPKDLPPVERPAAPNTGNPNVNKEYQQQQDKLISKQDQERQKLQQKQEQDHQRLLQQNADDARKQQIEQQHQQQTQQMQERQRPTAAAFAGEAGSRRLSSTSHHRRTRTRRSPRVKSRKKAVKSNREVRLTPTPSWCCPIAFASTNVLALARHCLQMHKGSELVWQPLKGFSR